MLGLAYGRHLHSLVRHHTDRNQSHSTFFIRNRPELELMRRLIGRRKHGSQLDVSVLACSKGAEVYSMVRAIRSARPDLNLNLHAVDISQEIVSFAERGCYARSSPSGPCAATTAGSATWRDQVWKNRFWSMFERMTAVEIREMFEFVGDQIHVRPWLKEGITWMQGDANDPRLADVLGPQDIVVANRFLCHMRTPAAERCLQNIGRLVEPGGFLFVSGVDLDVKTKIARKMGWKAVTDMIQEVYEGDASLIRGWPTHYWGAEPFSQDVSDWKMRYAAVFQIC
jgi:chemotaxis methyl-accepting protein methylase